MKKETGWLILAITAVAVVVGICIKKFSIKKSIEDVNDELENFAEDVEVIEVQDLSDEREENKQQVFSNMADRQGQAKEILAETYDDMKQAKENINDNKSEIEELMKQLKR